MRKRLFQLSEDYDGTLTATISTYSETGVRTSHEDLDVATLPGALCGDGAMLGPVAGVQPGPLTPDEIEDLAASAREPARDVIQGLDGEDVSPSEEPAQHTAEDNAATGEPEESEPPKGKLPADFPGHKDLDAAGVHTYGQLRKHVEADTLQEIPGIGKATAAKIVAALENE